MEYLVSESENSLLTDIGFCDILLLEELALDSLEKAISYDIKEKEELISSGFKIECPLLSEVSGRLGDRFQDLKKIMSMDALHLYKIMSVIKSYYAILKILIRGFHNVICSFKKA